MSEAEIEGDGLEPETEAEDVELEDFRHARDGLRVVLRRDQSPHDRVAEPRRLEYLRVIEARPVEKSAATEPTYGHLVTGAPDAFRSRLDSYGKLVKVIDSGRPQ
jgi:hypothetical protein